MSALPDNLAAYQAVYEANAAGLPGSAGWLGAFRGRAMQHLVEHGLPSTVEEDWKYTNLHKWLQGHDPHAPSTAGSELDLGTVEAMSIEGLAAHRFCFVDGIWSPANPSAPEGSRVVSLAATAGEGTTGLQDRIGNIVDLDQHRLAALNTALLGDGALIDIAPGAIPAAPIYLLFITTEGGPLVLPRIRIDAGAASEATVIEHFVHLGGGGAFCNSVTEIDLDTGARLSHLRLQEQHHDTLHVSSTHVRQAADSSFDSFNIDTGGGTVRNDLQIDLSAPGAQTELNGLFYANTGQHIDNHTRVDHRAPHTRSSADYRGILGGKTRAVFNGKIWVHQDAQQTDAQLSNKNLLLSETAEIDTKPELEIYADDVKCSHGATIGQLDEQAMFYLRARGIDPGMARSLLTYAFANDVINRIGIEAIRQRVAKATLELIPAGARIGE